MGDKGKEKGTICGECEGSVTVVNVSFYRVCPQMTNTSLLEQSLPDWYWGN